MSQKTSMLMKKSNRLRPKVKAVSRIRKAKQERSKRRLRMLKKLEEFGGLSKNGVLLKILHNVVKKIVEENLWKWFEALQGHQGLPMIIKWYLAGLNGPRIIMNCCGIAWQKGLSSRQQKRLLKMSTWMMEINQSRTKVKCETIRLTTKCPNNS